MREKHTAVWLGATLMVLGALSGCTPTGTRPDTLPQVADVPRPGTVMVDPERRRAVLKGRGEELCPIAEYALAKKPIPPVLEVEIVGNDLDPQLERPRKQMIDLGAACLRLEGPACQTAVDTMVTWAKADAARMRSCCDTDLFWDESIAVNLDVVRPFIGAYAIAHATVPVRSEDDAAIRAWMKKTVGRAKHLMRGYYFKGHNYAAHNHAIASAAAHMAYGAMWGDARAFDLGIDQWFITLGDMREDGSFPIEARRGPLAMFYTGRTLSGLTSIAEMARA